MSKALAVLFTVNTMLMYTPEYKQYSDTRFTDRDTTTTSPCPTTSFKQQRLASRVKQEVTKSERVLASDYFPSGTVYIHEMSRLALLAGIKNRRDGHLVWLFLELNYSRRSKKEIGL